MTVFTVTGGPFDGESVDLDGVGVFVDFPVVDDEYWAAHHAWLARWGLAWVSGRPNTPGMPRIPKARYRPSHRDALLMFVEVS